MYELTFNADLSNLEQIFAGMFMGIDDSLTTDNVRDLVAFVKSVGNNQKDAISLRLNTGNEDGGVIFAVNNRDADVDLLLVSDCEHTIQKLNEKRRKVCEELGI